MQREPPVPEKQIQHWEKFCLYAFQWKYRDTVKASVPSITL